MKLVPCLGWLLATTALPPAFAQVAPAAAPSAPAPAITTAIKLEQAIELSPFQVVSSNDQGWMAGSTMLGNRTNQPLKDTPITIDAMTKEFLMEVGAFTPEQAGAWVANVAVAPDTLRSDLGNFNYRGMTNQFSANRNFFRWYGPQDNYNVERLDFGRGSNSLIFGDNDPGGQTTTYTKRATMGRQFTKVLAQYGSWDSYRAEFDHNQPLGRTLAFRVNAVQRIDYRNFDYNKFRFTGLHGAITWEPTARTQIRIEGESSGNYRTWGENNLLIQERAFTGLGFTGRLTVLPNGKVVDNDLATGTPNGTPLGDGTIYNTATDRAQPAGGTGPATTFLDKSSYQPLLSSSTFRGFSEHTNFGGPDTTNDRWYSTYTVTAEHRFTEKLAVDLAFNQQNQWNEQIQYGAVKTASTDSIGRLFTDVTYNPIFVRNHMMQYRGSVSYNFDRWSWMKQFFVFRSEYRDDRNINRQQQLRAFGPNFGVTTNVQPVYRVYLTNPYPATAITTQRVFATPPPNTRLFTNVAGGENYIARAFSGSASGRYFDGRVLSLLGARYDANYGRGKNQAINGVTRDPVTLEQVELGDRIARPDVWILLPNFLQKKWTYNAGLVYVINPSINVYASYATSFRWGGQTDLISQPPPGAHLGKTWEFGLKGTFLNERLAWNVAAYDLVRDNIPTVIARTGIPASSGTGPTGLTGVDLSMSNAINWGLAPLSPDFKTITTGTSRDVTSQNSRGVETTLTYFPATGLSVRLSGAYKQVNFIESFPVLKGVLTAAEARSPITDPLVQQTVAALKNSAYVQAGSGRYVTAAFPAVVAPLSGNFAVSYRFSRSSALAGWNVGLNGTYSGDAVLRYLSAVNETTIKGGSTYALNSNVGYRTKLFNRPTTFMLNLSNLTATKYQVISSLARFDGSNHNVNIYGQPFQFRLTSTMEF